MACQAGGNSFKYMWGKYLWGKCLRDKYPWGSWLPFLGPRRGFGEWAEPWLR